MLVLALDTTTRLGSFALVDGTTVCECGHGDVERAHAERLPAEIHGLLRRHGRSLGDVDLLAVAAGPGSFTGLRIGIASMQGLAFAASKPLIGVSALDALARAASRTRGAASRRIGVWMDGQRGEVFGARYTQTMGATVADGEPMVGTPASIASQWASEGCAGLCWIGDGALAYRDTLASVPGLVNDIVEPVPLIAEDIAALAVERFAMGGCFLPHAIVPLYVRRPDAELARDRQASGA